MAETEGRFDRGDGVELAWKLISGRSPVVVFLPGFRSDMAGLKASTLAAFCAANDRALLRFDYSGHGESAGRFEDGTIGAWTDDALAVIDEMTTERLVLVGSSMGGWIALNVGLARPERIAAIIGIAPAPDFTETLMWQAMAPPERSRLLAEGHLAVPSEYGEPLVITRALIEDGRNHLRLGGPIDISCPVRLLHGQRDPDVPWETSMTLADRLASNDVQLILLKDGDHRLSRPRDLALIERTLAALLAEDGG